MANFHHNNRNHGYRNRKNHNIEERDNKEFREGGEGKERRDNRERHDQQEARALYRERRERENKENRENREPRENRERRERENREPRNNREARDNQVINTFTLGTKEFEGKNAEFQYDKGMYSIVDIVGEEKTVVYKSKIPQDAYLKWNVYIGRKKERPQRAEKTEN